MGNLSSRGAADAPAAGTPGLTHAQVKEARQLAEWLKRRYKMGERVRFRREDGLPGTVSRDEVRDHPYIYVAWDNGRFKGDTQYEVNADGLVPECAIARALLERYVDPPEAAAPLRARFVDPEDPSDTPLSEEERVAFAAAVTAAPREPAPTPACDDATLAAFQAYFAVANAKGYDDTWHVQLPALLAELQDWRATR